ncbi:MAG TPA: Trm112 family protein [Pyrinomonadaceae bacterium]|nr:Trm112 family protein [Pyrinomonadaceae bacterium]
MPISPELLEILRCPKCRSKVKINDEQTSLACENAECRLVYPIRDDIPVMIVEEAAVES